MIAEDIDSNYKLICYFLRGINADLIRACNGKEALDLFLNEEKIDLILMDVKMPVMDGYSTIKIIREKNSSILIIVQSAYTDEGSISYHIKAI